MSTVQLLTVGSTGKVKSPFGMLALFSDVFFAFFFFAIYEKENLFLLHLNRSGLKYSSDAVHLYNLPNYFCL